MARAVEGQSAGVTGTSGAVPRRRRVGMAMSALAAFLVTPVLTTAMYRLVPDTAPAWESVPFFVLGSVAVALWLWRPRWRPVAGAVTTALVLDFAFLWWLMANFEVIE